MTKKDGFYFVRGELHWPKVLGDALPNYNKDGHEWTFELKPDDEGLKTLRALGLMDRVNKGENKDRILFRQRLERKDGKHNNPISVYDSNNRPWDQSVKIGNGSIADVKFKFQQNKGKYDSVYPQGIRVLEHVPYQRQEFAPLSEEDQFFRAPLPEDEHDDNEDEE